MANRLHHIGAALILFVILHRDFVQGRINTSSSDGDYYTRSKSADDNATNPATNHFSIINDTHTISTDLNFQYDDIEKLNESNYEIPIDPQLLSSSSLYELHLERSSVIFGLTKVANSSNVNSACYKQLRYTQEAILRKEPWAMKVLDASGSKPSGFVFGQNFWLGSREACGAVQRPVAITLSKNFERVMHDGLINQISPFDVDYRVVYLRHNSPWQVEIKLMSEQIIHIGLCLPQSCESHELKELVDIYMRDFFVDNEIYDIRPEVVYMKDLKLSESFYQKKSFKILTIITILTVGMMFGASLLREKEIADSQKKSEMKSIDDNDDDHKNSTEISIILDLMMKIKDFIKCFDVHANCETLFTIKENTNPATDIPIINGLRSIGAIWILVFHVSWFMYFTVDNKTFLVSYAESIFFIYVSSAPLLVDVFFTISGFLQTFNFIRNVKQLNEIRENNFQQNVRKFAKLLFHRYLRLAPVYLVIVAAVDLLSAYVADVSVYHIHERYDEICPRYWWRNILFIQNLFDHREMCLNWTWSLACEMQFYILSTILLFIYAKRPALTKSLVIGTFILNILWTFNIGLNSKFLLSFDSAYSTGTVIYINPLVRIMPYILGSIIGWYLEKHNLQFEVSPIKEKICWNLAITMFLTCIYSTIKRDISYIITMVLFVFGRISFSLSVCWMIYGSISGRGQATWWSRILEAKLFQHLNRLSYTFYLLNPFVISFCFSLTSTSTHADPTMMFVLATGFVIIVYLGSIVFSVAFEMPYYNWSRQLLKNGKSNNKNDNTNKITNNNNNNNNMKILNNNSECSNTETTTTTATEKKVKCN